MPKNLSGAWGETYAARYLRDEGCQIIAANVSNRYGEVDIIAADKEYIFFAEVKTRGENAIASPAESVTYQKQRKICGVAAAFLQSHKYDLQPRFDVIEVWLDKDSKLKKINHIKNAFDSTI
ncbi:MAG: YraN family protein [Clostridiales bacterium]|nr:YraN family protein [Clostridiales bacterium]